MLFAGWPGKSGHPFWNCSRLIRVKVQGLYCSSCKLSPCANFALKIFVRLDLTVLPWVSKDDQCGDMTFQLHPFQIIIIIHVSRPQMLDSNYLYEAILHSKLANYSSLSKIIFFMLGNQTKPLTKLNKPRAYNSHFMLHLSTGKQVKIYF